MKTYHFKRCTLLLTLAITSSLSGLAHAGSVQCDQPTPSERLTCQMMKVSAMVLGGAVVAADSVMDTFSKKLPVVVKMPNGALIQGHLLGKALRGRVVEADQTVSLFCKVNAPSTGSSFGYCTLDYPSLPPHPNEVDYYAKTGLQPAYGFTIDKYGIPDPNLIELARPLTWIDGVGL